MLQELDRISVIIANIISVFDQLKQLTSISEICTSQFQEFSDILQNRKAAIEQYERDRVETMMKQSINTKQLNQEITENALQSIFSETMNLLLLIQLCGKKIWPRVSLSLDIASPFEELHRFQIRLYEQFVRLGLEDGDEYVNSKQAIEKDLLKIKSFYESTQKKDDPIVQSQIEKINNLYSKYKIDIPTELMVFDYDPIIEAKDWHFDISKLDSNGKILLSNNNFSISVQKDKSDANISYIVFDMLNPHAIRENITNKERRLMLLSAINSNSILEFVGGYVKDDIYKAIFKHESDLILKDIIDDSSHKLNNPATLTKIAYYVATGMNYLYENDILHGNLSLSTILVKEDGELVQPFLFGFGFSIPNRRAYRPPEFFSEGIYTLKSDIYQYGLLLWELGRQEEVYRNVPDSRLIDVILDESQQLPLDNEHFSESMQKLISECLSPEPECRPDFADIIQRFKCGHIYFGNAKNSAMEFAQSLRAQQFKSILDKVNGTSHGMNALVDFLSKYGFNTVNQNDRTQLTNFIIEKSNELVNFVNETIAKENPVDRSKLFQSLIDMELFNILTPKILETPNKNDIVNMYCQLSTPFENTIPECVNFSLTFINNFLNSGGTDVIINALLSKSDNVDLGLKLLSAILFALPINHRLSILPSTILSKQIYYSRRLIEKCDEPSFTSIIATHIPILSTYLQDDSIADDVALLIKYYIKTSKGQQDLCGISATDVIKSGFIDLLRELMNYPPFLSSIVMKDCVSIVETLASKSLSNEQKDCALLLSLGLSSDVFKVYANFLNLLDLVMAHSNQELASRFIARVAQFPNASEYLATKVDFFMNDANISNGWYLVALSRIAGYYPKIVVNFTGLKDKLKNNIDNHVQIEATIRLLGTLSLIRSFWTDGPLSGSIIRLLESKTLTQFETLLCLSVLSNVSSYVNLNKHYFLFVTLAEIGNEVSGLALRILSRLELPVNTTSSNNRALRRVILLCKERIQSEDEFARQECANIILHLIDYNEQMKNILLKENLDKLTYDVAMKEKSPYIFISLVKSYDGLCPQSQPQTLFDQMEIRSELKLPREFYELRQKMCGNDYK